jgi:hypothetical protein
MSSLFLGTVVRHLGFNNNNASFLSFDSYRVLLSAGFYEDSLYREVVNIIPKVFFYFHYPSYENDLLFKTRVLPFQRHLQRNGLTHFMSYRIDLVSLSYEVLAYAFGIIRGNYYVRPSTTRRNNYHIRNTSTNVTSDIFSSNMTYIGGITTVGINDTESPTSIPIDSIILKLRDVDLVFTTLFTFPP